MGIISSKMRSQNKNTVNMTSQFISPLLTKEDIINGTVINEYEDSNEDSNEYETPICKNTQLSKLEKIFKSSFKPKHDIYHEWINLYLWHKYYDMDQVPSYYNFISIYSNEYIENRNINIQLILSGNFGYYFIIKYNVYQWGENFSPKYNVNNNFDYKIQTPQSFDKTIEYFSNIGYQSINSLKPFRELLEDKYSDEYL